MPKVPGLECQGQDWPDSGTWLPDHCSCLPPLFFEAQQGTCSLRLLLWGLFLHLPSARWVGNGIQWIKCQPPRAMLISKGTLHNGPHTISCVEIASSHPAGELPEVWGHVWRVVHSRISGQDSNESLTSSGSRSLCPQPDSHANLLTLRPLTTPRSPNRSSPWLFSFAS